MRNRNISSALHKDSLETLEIFEKFWSTLDDHFRVNTLMVPLNSLMNWPGKMLRRELQPCWLFAGNVLHGGFRRRLKSYVNHAFRLPIHFDHLHLKQDRNCNELKNQHFIRVAYKNIIITASAEILCKSCFLKWYSLKSLTFEIRSKVHRIKESQFSSNG
jgi:hypothetical protein